MHKLAEQWDRANGKRVSEHKIVDGVFIPVNRPCDWCGVPVKLGYIHKKCEVKERTRLLDILY